MTTFSGPSAAYYFRCYFRCCFRYYFYRYFFPYTARINPATATYINPAVTTRINIAATYYGPPYYRAARL